MVASLRLRALILTAVARQEPDRAETVDFPCGGAGHFPVMMLTIVRLLSVILTSFRLHSELALEYLALP